MLTLFDATVRMQVSVTFGAGLFADSAPCDEALPTVSRKASIPSPADQAWWLGYSVGVEGYNAVAPAGVACSFAEHTTDWTAGYEAGLDKFRAEHDRDYNEWIDEQDRKAERHEDAQMAGFPSSPGTDPRAGHPAFEL